MKEELEIREICRLCLSQEKLRPLSESEFAEDFNNFNFIEVVLNYTLPKVVCEKCLDELNKIAQFIKKCRESYDTLTQTNEQNERDEKQSVIKVEMLDHVEYIKTEEIDLKLEESVSSSFETASECANNSDVATSSDANNCNRALDASPQEYMNCVIPDKSSSIYDIESCHKTSKAFKICDRCGELVTKMIDHYKVSKTCYPKNFKCEICNQGCNSDDTLQRHRIVYHWNQISQNSLMCHICSKMFKHENNLRRHIRVHKYGKRFICEVCGKGFTTNAMLKDHSNAHTGKRPYCCRYCGKTFSQAPTHATHERGHRKIQIQKQKQKKCVKMPDPSESVFCKICNRQFSRMKFLKQHMRSHDDNRFYQCKICKQTFETTLLFREHSTSHISEKQHPCSYCSKRFTERNRLITHERIHTGERPFVCTVCNKTFSQGTHLKRHTTLMHGDVSERPFHCSFCEKGFAGKGNLTVHERIHTGERPFPCHICQKGFIDSSGRKKHVKAIHGEDEVKI